MPETRAGALRAVEIAALTGGRLIGPGDVSVRAVAPLDRAGPGDLTFVASARYLRYLERSRAAVVLCAPEFADAPGDATRIVVKDPYAALLALLPRLYPEPEREWGVHPSVVIGAGARWTDPVLLGPRVVLGRDVVLGANVRLGPGCVIGDGVTIGDDSELLAAVTCYPRTVIGRRVRAHAGVVLGSDGFGYVPGKEGHRKIPHVGGCVIGDDVEIGANTTVDRGSVGDTVVGAGTKIDNLVQVGHNVRIGARCIIMAQVGIAGSTTIEDDCVLAGQVGLAGHITLGRGVRVAAQSGVDTSVEPGTTMFGYPAREHREQLRTLAALNRLARIARELEDLASRHGQDTR